LYKEVEPDFKDKGGSSLAACTLNIMGKKLCKKEQMSNWENRPLRYSQEHYAAMDAWILAHMTPVSLKMFKSTIAVDKALEASLQCIEPAGMQVIDKNLSITSGSKK
jgi:ribonuclease D